jgi:putative spermidine/putrescine transport system permease protein
VAAQGLSADGPGTLVVARARPRVDRVALLALPCLLFLFVFFWMPLLAMAWRSLTDPSPANYLVFASSSIYAQTLLITFRTALVVTLVCLLVGYPYAYLMHHAGPRLTLVLLTMILLPFWSSVLVRAFGWTVVLSERGLISGPLLDLGWIREPLPLMRNALGVTIGMSHFNLPFMVLPIYAAMRRIDQDLVPAAESLGAPPLRSFLRVFLPLSLPGVVAGCLLVFLLSIGFFVIPDLLGGPRDTMYSQVAVTHVTQLLQFGVGSALAMVLLAVTLLLLWIVSRFTRLDDTLGYQTQ